MPTQVQGTAGLLSATRTSAAKPRGYPEFVREHRPRGRVSSMFGLLMSGERTPGASPIRRVRRKGWMQYPCL